MVVVIFRSWLEKGITDEYEQTAKRMAELVSQMPGFISFKTFAAEDGERVSLIEFESEEAVKSWREHPEHLMAQQRGRESFYREFKIQICGPVRSHQFKR